MQYVAFIYREQEETRWFHRYVLRRKRRRSLFHAGLVDNFTLQRDLNQIANCSLVLADPMEKMERYRLPVGGASAGGSA